MKSGFCFPLLIFSYLFLAACGSKEIKQIELQGGEQIKGNEIHAIFGGSRLNMTGYDEDATLIFHLNGRISAENKLGEKNDGLWGVENKDNLCLKFKRWGGGDKICYTVYRLDDNYIFFRKNIKRYDVSIIDPNFESASEKKGSGITLEIQDKQPETDHKEAEDEQKKTSDLEVLSPRAKQDVGMIVREIAKECPGCNLMGANLTGADLASANLEGANLAGADLRFANLRRANLKGANLYNADLTGADIRGAEMKGANLQGAAGL